MRPTPQHWCGHQHPNTGAGIQTPMRPTPRHCGAGVRTPMHGSVSMSVCALGRLGRDSGRRGDRMACLRPPQARWCRCGQRATCCSYKPVGVAADSRPPATATRESGPAGQLTAMAWLRKPRAAPAPLGSSDSNAPVQTTGREHRQSSLDEVLLGKLRSPGSGGGGGGSARTGGVGKRRSGHVRLIDCSRYIKHVIT